MTERGGEDYAAHMKRKRAADAERKLAKAPRMSPGAMARARDHDRLRKSQERTAMSSSGVEAAKVKHAAGMKQARDKRKSGEITSGEDGARDYDRLRMSQARSEMSESEAEAAKVKHAARMKQARAKRKSDAFADEHVARETAKRCRTEPAEYEHFRFDDHMDVEADEGEEAIDFGAAYASPRSDAAIAALPNQREDGISSNDESQSSNGEEGAAGSFHCVSFLFASFVIGCSCQSINLFPFPLHCQLPIARNSD